MFLSSREQKILTYLIASPEGVMLDELENLLNVSRRTVYRELSTLEKTLSTSSLQVVKPRGEGYRLVGELHEIERLKKQLNDEHDHRLDMQNRQRAIAAMLLLADQEITMESLAIEFEVSVGTINSDLNAIGASLEDFGLRIERLKTRGILISSGEKERRQIVSGLIYGSVTELEFYQYLNHLSDNNMMPSSHYFLQLIQPESFYLAKQVLFEEHATLFSSVTDNQLQQIVIILALSIDRMLAGHVIDEAIPASKINSQMIQYAHKIMMSIERGLKQAIDINERHFFARQLEGLNYKTKQNIFVESFDAQLSYQVKELIHYVTLHSGNDFRKDNILYYDLSTHIQAALKRPMAIIDSTENPVLAKISQEYQWLEGVVREGFEKFFPDQVISHDEMSYIVIHFASSLERSPKGHYISALVLCSSGIGTSKILESRIKKFIPEIHDLEVAKVSQLDQLNYDRYDLILSTLYLPEFDQNYRVISPLLLDDEIREIRESLEELEEELESLPKPSEFRMKQTESFDTIYQMTMKSKQLLDLFQFKKVNSQDTFEKTLLHIIDSLESCITKYPKEVTESVIERYLQAPVGIPKTQVALMHSSNELVENPFFGVYELDSPFSVLGMDRKSIELKRILLLLAPEPLEDLDQRLLGRISQSMIDTDLNTQIYQDGTEKMIYELLESLFVQEIQMK